MKFINAVTGIIHNRFPTWNLKIFTFFVILSVGFILLIRHSKLNTKQRIASAGLFFYSYNVLIVTLLSRTPYYEYRYELMPFSFIPEIIKNGRLTPILEFPLNIALFLPIGFILPYLINRVSRYADTMIIGFLATFSIEILQLVTKLGSFEADDIIANLLGTWLGLLLYKKVRRRYLQKKKLCRRRQEF